MMGFFDKYTDITAQIEVITNLQVIQHWDTLAVLCHMVNAKDSGPKEASRALRRRLKNGVVFQQLNSITVIQVLIDGCGSKFKAQVATQKFANMLSYLVTSAETKPVLRSRLMERLGAWAQSFSGDPGLSVIPQLYQHLSSVVRVPINNVVLQQAFLPALQPERSQQQLLRSTVAMTPEQKQAMIRQDIELANNNAHMLSEAVSFADPDLEAVEENDLIKEFHSKCLTLQRGIQIYLTELTDSPTPDELLMNALLAANQELVLAFSAHTQMMDTRKQVRLARAGHMFSTTNAQPEMSDLSPDTPIHDVLVFREPTGSSSGSASSSRSASPTTAHQQVIDPFADQAYYVSGPTDVVSIVKQGKQPRPKQAAVTDFILQQEKEEREYLRQLQEQPMVSLPQSSSSSSPATRA